VKIIQRILVSLLVFTDAGSGAKPSRLAPVKFPGIQDPWESVSLRGTARISPFNLINTPQGNILINSDFPEDVR